MDLHGWIATVVLSLGGLAVVLATVMVWAGWFHPNETDETE